jgi:hypothetical protein
MKTNDDSNQRGFIWSHLYLWWWPNWYSTKVVRRLHFAFPPRGTQIIEAVGTALKGPGRFEFEPLTLCYGQLSGNWLSGEWVSDQNWRSCPVQNPPQSAMARPSGWPQPHFASTNRPAGGCRQHQIANCARLCRPRILENDKLGELQLASKVKSQNHHLVEF